MSSLLHPTASTLYAVAVIVSPGIIFALRRMPPVFFLAVFPATLAHEFMHLAAALLLNGRPMGFRVIPRRSHNGYVLGAVTCANLRWYNGALIGLAPLALLVATVMLFNWRVDGRTAMSGGEALWAYAIACLAYAAIPSWQDIKMALATSWWVIILAVAVAALWGRWI